MTTVPATTHNRPTRVPAVWLVLAGVAALAVAVSTFVATIDKDAVTAAGSTSTNQSAQIARDVNQPGNYVDQYSARINAHRNVGPGIDTQAAASQVAPDVSPLGNYVDQYSARINAHRNVGPGIDTQAAASQLAPDVDQLGNYLDQYSARINSHVAALTGSVEPD